MTRLQRFFAIIGLAVVLVGTGACSATFKQAETVRRLLPTGSTSDSLMGYAWLLSFNGTELLVFPVEAKGRQVLFAGADGLRLRWDGESIISIEGMPGAFGRYESGVEPGRDERWYAQEGFPLMRAACSPRRQWRLSDRQFGWRQECNHTSDERPRRANHLVEFDERGNITLIEASSRPGGSDFSLRRMR